MYGKYNWSLNDCSGPDIQQDWPSYILMMFGLPRVQRLFCIPKVVGTCTASLQCLHVLFLMSLLHRIPKMLVAFAHIFMIIHFLASVSETPHFHHIVCLFLWKFHCYGFLLDWSIECKVVNNRLKTRVLASDCRIEMMVCVPMVGVCVNGESLKSITNR